jgi:hypothetical protein
VRPGAAVALLCVAIGIAASFAIALSPQLVRLFESGPSVKGHGYAEGIALTMLLLAGACFVVAVIASVIGWFAARHAGVSGGLLVACWVPIPLAMLGAGVLWSRITR